MLDRMVQLDHLVFSWVNSGLSCAMLDETMPAVSYLGVWWLGTAILATIILWRRSRASLLAGIAYAVAGGTSTGLKMLVLRWRPALLAGATVLERNSSGMHGGFLPWEQTSFPSSHAAAVFAMATLVADYWPRYGVIAYAAAAAVGFSRVYVGVHYPTDVLAGMVIGVGLTKLVLRNRVLRRSILGEEAARRVQHSAKAQ